MPEDQSVQQPSVRKMLREHMLAVGFMAAMLFALISIVWLFAVLNRNQAAVSQVEYTTKAAPLTVQEKTQVLQQLAAQGFGLPKLSESEKTSVLSQLSVRKAEASTNTQPLTEEQKLHVLNRLQQ